MDGNAYGGLRAAYDAFASALEASKLPNLEAEDRNAERVRYLRDKLFTVQGALGAAFEVPDSLPRILAKAAEDTREADRDPDLDGPLSRAVADLRDAILTFFIDAYQQETDLTVRLSQREKGLVEELESLQRDVRALEGELKAEQSLTEGLKTALEHATTLDAHLAQVKGFAQAGLMPIQIENVVNLGDVGPVAVNRTFDLIEKLGGALARVELTEAMGRLWLGIKNGGAAVLRRLAVGGPRTEDIERMVQELERLEPSLDGNLVSTEGGSHFGARYFGSRYFGARYFGGKRSEPLEKSEIQTGADPASLPDFATFRDADFAPEMVVIPPGSFQMGSAEGEGIDQERPRHPVSIGYRFAVGRYPVTFEEYEVFCAAIGRAVPSDQNRGRNRRPVINVSWHDAQVYLTWLNGELGLSDSPLRYRLLSEAEWEYCCRAGGESAYWWGDEEPDETRANFGVAVGRPREVGSYGDRGENGFKLSDMAGNVWEWVEDEWHDDYTGAPVDGSAWTEGEDERSVLRGGSWGNRPWSLRSAFRGRGSPDVRVNVNGFRVSRTLSR